MTFVLKVECDGDLRRALLQGTPSFDDIDHAVQEIWPGRSADGGKYCDEEGDACTLKEQTFSDFLATAKEAANGSLLRLTLSPSDGYQAGYEPAETQLATEAFASPWQHVEQSSESGEGGIHTVADLTDMQQEDTALVDDTETDTVAHAIHTPTQSPREKADSPECEASGDLVKTVDTMEEPAVDEKKEEEASASCAEQTRAEPEVPGAAVEDLIIDHDVEEKIDIVMAAFDEDGDDHLNFVEMSALHNAAWGGHISPETFKQMCADEGEDPTVGLGREALMCIYSRCRTLEKDFEAARLKLEGNDVDYAAVLRQRCEASARPIDLVRSNPRLAVPIALDTAERLRQSVVSRIGFKS